MACLTRENPELPSHQLHKKNVSVKALFEEQGNKPPPKENSFKPAKILTKGLDFDYEPGFGLSKQLNPSIYLVLLISAATILICLFLSRSGFSNLAPRNQQIF